MKNTLEPNPITCCNVCGVDSRCTITHSRIAPVSYNLCDKCSSKNAENLDVICIWLILDGLASANDRFFSKLCSFQNGDYIDWPEIKIYFENNKDRIIESLKSDDSEYLEEIKDID